MCFLLRDHHTQLKSCIRYAFAFYNVSYPRLDFSDNNTKIYAKATAQKLFFSRDPLGRRSLLIHRPSATNPYFLLASVSAGPDPGYSFEELDTGHIHCLDIATLNEANDVSRPMIATSNRSYVGFC